MHDLFFCTFAHCKDISLGKVDKSTLSQQTLMELLIQDITNREILCGDVDDPSDISDWSGVTVSSKGEVKEIHWSYAAYKGNKIYGHLAIEYLPGTVTCLRAGYNALEGTLPLTDLPPEMDSLHAGNNKLSGTLNFEHLPNTLDMIHLFFNAFSGTISLVRLPPKMRYLIISNNPISGETDFSRLPESLMHFDVSRTDLSGTIVLREKNVGFQTTHSEVQIIIKE
mmetsp:Transcript_15807/g.24678  ORF Transcript_15807/g.24678 Transcript_15807/m.24678 type:complete len:225 (-) Transcript_15807:55-729(-)